MPLTDRQRKELNEAVGEYIASLGEGFEEVAESFERLVAEKSDYDNQAPLGRLERKWITVVRLQKRIMDLEDRVESLQEAERAAEKGARGAPEAASEAFLPRPPAAIVLSGQRKAITSIAIHPTFSLVATASEDGTVALWDQDTGEKEVTLRGHTGSVTSACFSPDGSVLVTGSADATAKLWDITVSGGAAPAVGDGRRQRSCRRSLVGHSGEVTGVAFVPRRGWVVSCSRDGTVRLWEAGSGRGLGSFRFSAEEDSWVRCVDAAPCGDLLAVAAGNKVVLRSISESGDCVELRQLDGHAGVVESVQFAGAAAAGALATALQAKRASEAGDGHGDSAPAAAGAAAAAAAGAGGVGGVYLVTGARDCRVCVWDCRSFSRVADFPSAHSSWVLGVAFHPCGRFVVSVGEDRALRVWDVPAGRAAKELLGAHEHFASCVAVAKSRPVMASGSVDAKALIWQCR